MFPLLKYFKDFLKICVVVFFSNRKGQLCVLKKYGAISKQQCKKIRVQIS